ncbi:uncharacterized protein LOC144452932 isoform X1 [Glandiceps talaboti]
MAANSYGDRLQSVPDDISIAYLPGVSSLSTKAQDKGLNYFTQGYVHDIKINNASNDLKVLARCWRSMRKSESPHKIEVDISRVLRKVTNANCSCKAGLSGHCSHVIGLIKSLQGLKLHNFTNVPAQLSCTSIPQQWHVPRGPKIKPVPINHVVVARPTIETRKRRPIVCQVDSNKKLPKVTSTDIGILQNLKGTPLAYTVSDDVPTTDTSFGEVQLGSMLSYQMNNMKTSKVSDGMGCGPTTLPKTAPIKLPEEYRTLNKEHSQIDPETLEIETRGQANNKTWIKSRACRLTASNFGRILNRKSAPSEKFLNSLFQHKSITAASLEYGKRNELKAKSKYLEVHTCRHIHDCGLVVNTEFSFLGGTPDGKVCDHGKCGIMECKCPYCARNLTIDQAVNEVPNFMLHRGPDGEIVLKRTHPYFVQVQGQLMVTGAEFCDFVVFTQIDVFIQRILPDVEYMQEMLQKLCAFFQKYAKPYLCKK